MCWLSLKLVILAWRLLASRDDSFSALGFLLGSHQNLGLGNLRPSAPFSGRPGSSIHPLERHMIEYGTHSATSLLGEGRINYLCRLFSQLPSAPRSYPLGGYLHDSSSSTPTLVSNLEIRSSIRVSLTIQAECFSCFSRTNRPTAFH
ncbi:hypothetical protein AG1IA_01545 [Rhizoctonia solani AG-1 IA]|uniref:Secreted protein n=1 Tax=Thanatephorus cucumeris (strain AG1-IA) TaxID=983506 RepID=L8X5Q8_THACA|nr:hypothetical protein AG1IA_01545 [Rhizoctonia solani AG-1 IA]